MDFVFVASSPSTIGNSFLWHFQEIVKCSTEIFMFHFLQRKSGENTSAWGFPLLLAIFAQLKFSQDFSGN
jgi:hypothetical protein